MTNSRAKGKRGELQVAELLRQHGIPATIYTEKSATDQLGSRLPGLVARVGHTRDREIQLGVNYWDQANNEIPQVHFSVAGVRCTVSLPPAK